MAYDKLILPNQREPAVGRKQILNRAGGYVFEIDKWKRLDRFLILGSDGGSYYASAKELTKENAENLIDCVREDGDRMINQTVLISDRGLAVKNDAAIFALAVASVFGNELSRKHALLMVPNVCRIGTHLFQFCKYREALGGGWGRGVKRAIAAWYQGLETQKLILQLLKYQQRDGWSHRDVLRLAHIEPQNDLQKRIFRAVTTGEWGDLAMESPNLVGAWLDLKHLAEHDAHDIASQLIHASRVPRELVPTEFLTYPEIWDALLPTMPMTAMIRNLSNMSKSGLLSPLSNATARVIERLDDEALLHKARIHPMSILLALKTYAAGAGFRGGNTWPVNQDIVAALDSAFYKAFHNIEPTGKRIVVGVDVSGSMSWSAIPGTNMTSAEAAAAVAMMIKRTEKNTYVMGFSTQFVDLGISAADSLDDVLTKTSHRNFGGTNTSVAIQWALDNGVLADAFIILTDSETWAGDTHTYRAMETYRNVTGLPTKLAVCAFESSRHSVADQEDFLSMDFVGLDASLPQALSAFLRE